MSTLGDELPKEIARVRDEVLPEYVALGQSGAFTATLMRKDLNEASRAMIESDLPAMIRIYESLKEWQL